MPIAPFIVIAGIGFWSTVAFLTARSAIQDPKKPLRSWVRQIEGKLPLWPVVGVGYTVMLVLALVQIQIFLSAEVFNAAPMMGAMFSGMISSACLACALPMNLKP